MRYLKGHDKRGKRFPPHGKRLEQIRMARERHLRVVEDYQRGLSLDRIAERHGFAGAASVGWVIARARARGEVIARRNRVPAPSLDGATVRRLVRMWRRGATASEMRQVFGWSRAELGSAVQSARKDFDLPMRAARPSQFTPDERRVLKRKAVKIKPQGDLTDRQRTVLRLLQASSEPVAGGALAEIMCLLGYTYSPGRVYSVLDQMRRKRLLARAESRARYRHAPKWVWFVPLDREQPAVTLTLDDAKRESELAALIREQEQEAARGHWAEIDPKTLSMDAEFSEDGGSWHDILVADEDDPFKASVATR